MTPEAHDHVFAAVSHLPHVIAYALVNTLIELEKESEGIISDLQAGSGISHVLQRVIRRCGGTYA